MMNDPTGPDDASVAQSLRELLLPMDRHLERGRNILAAALVLSPLPFILFWLIGYSEAKHAAGWSVLCFGLLVLAGLTWEWFMDRLIRWRFNRRFTVGSPARAVALRLLDTIETPNQVEEKLRELAEDASDTPRPDTNIKPQGQEPLPLLELPPETPVPSSAPPVRGVATSRPGGYYDYIPLEPLPGDEPKDRTPGS